jgi:hypothetical protein
MLFRSSHCGGGGGGGGGEEKNVTVGGGSIHDIGWAHGHRYGVIELHPIVFELITNNKINNKINEQLFPLDLSISISQ